MSGSIKLAKMSGAGNDFVVLDGEQAAGLGDLPSLARRLCRRGLSVGADGLLVVAPAGRDRVDVRFHNPDGGTAFCGNGSRCAARFAVLRGMADATMTLVTAIGDVPARVENERVLLTLPAPTGGERLQLSEVDPALDGRFVDAGTPHVVVPVDLVRQAPLATWGPAVRRHVRFAPRGTNLTLVERRGPDRIAVRTWERGVEGETLSCGSGAVAAAFATRLDGGAAQVSVLAASGVTLTIELGQESATMTGDARLIFEGVASSEATSAIPDRT